MPGGAGSRWLVVAVMAIGAAGALAQPEPVVPQAVTDPAGEVMVEVGQFGLGAVARPGELVGIELLLTDRSDRPRAVVVRLELRDADGDTTVYRRTPVLNPGVRQRVWLYARLPFWFQAGQLVRVTVHEAIEAGPGVEAGAMAYRAGRQIGSARIAAREVVPAARGLLAVVGHRSLGLGAYGLSAGLGVEWHPAGHELTSTITGLRPDDLPDRWMGLAALSALIWLDGAPGELSPQRAEAIREWVHRGGHLVVILPAVGQGWLTPAANPLHDLMPAVRVDRRESAWLGAYEPLLRRDVGSERLDLRGVVHVFEPMPDAGREEAAPILSGPDGGCVVVRRLVGAGAVTLVGLDLNAPGLSALDLPKADAFWNRVLGRRGDALSASQLPPMQVFRDPVYRYDEQIGSVIGLSGRAEVAVLMGLVVFAVYWGVAGPLGFWMLHRRGRAQHGWVLFVAAAGLFTLIAWGGASMLRPARVEARHLRLVDHVYGQRQERARAWVTLLLPWYGEAVVRVAGSAGGGDDVADGSAAQGDALWPWDPPGGGSGGAFPDARPYEIDAASPQWVRVPTRSTVKQFQVDWSGGARWEMPWPAPPPGQTGHGTIRLIPGTHQLEGVLYHRLPGPLEDLLVIVIEQQAPLSATGSGQLLANASAYKRPMPWQPGEPLNLATLGSAGPEQRELAQVLLKDLVSVRRIEEQLVALSLFPQLEPPNYRDRIAQRPLARREATHGWDLGIWFTQPCVILIGHLRDREDPVASPAAVEVDGRVVRSVGHTVVRWIYPLEPAPPAWPAGWSPRVD